MGGGDDAADALRALPSVEVLAATLDGPRPLAVRAAREVDRLTRRDGRARRAGARRRAISPTLAQARLDALVAPSLRRVVNATGVVVHTNLGRAPLAARRAGGGRPGGRGLRQPRVRPRAAASAAPAPTTWPS